jgi:hypothetical protein
MSEDKKENTKIVLIRPEEGVFETYSNFVDAVWTLFDVTFRFAQIVPAPPESGRPFDAVENAAITVAWPEAKIISRVLTDLVRRYEATNGEIQPLKLTPNSEEMPLPYPPE